MPRAIRAGAFHANLGHFAELLEPAKQHLVVGGICRERLGADQSAEGVECRSDVFIQVGIDTTRNPGSSVYDGHGHPYLPKRLRGGTAVLYRSDGWSELFLATRANHPTSETGVPLSMWRWKSSADDVRRRLVTPSRAKSSSAPEAIEDQLQSGGP